MLLPPPDETAEEREARVVREEGARAISEGIDGELMRERNVVRKKRERVVKLLLLGQSESGE